MLSAACKLAFLAKKIVKWRFRELSLKARAIASQFVQTVRTREG